MKRIVLTGGGSAGHVTPNLALIPKLKELGFDIHYIGTENGIERGLIEALPNITYHAVKSGKLRRYFSIENFKDPFKVLYGAFQSFGLIRKLKPDVLFSKGGFVAVPVVIGAWLNRVPAICHESDLTPGLANRICIRFCKKIAVTFPECKASIGEKAVLTGTPLRESLFEGSRAKGLSLMGASGDRPVLMMMGGSQGAQSVNAVLREALPELTKRFFIFHVCGKGNTDEILNNTPGYKQVEYLSDELPDALAAADLLLSRAGSNSICEFHALKKPMLLVPYPMGASRGDQILNAESLKKRGLCHVLLQSDLNRESLIKAIDALYDDRRVLEAAMAAQPATEGTEAVLKLILEQVK
jgi:undecaprenyldiphospho-muramoylpentapeptide beta-N-acetylglucosaminyltransferase